MISPSVRSTSRNTPCVLGCCGPMLTSISSVRTSNSITVGSSGGTGASCVVAYFESLPLRACSSTSNVFSCGGGVPLIEVSRVVFCSRLCEAGSRKEPIIRIAASPAEELLVHVEGVGEGQASNFISVRLHERRRLGVVLPGGGDDRL